MNFNIDISIFSLIFRNCKKKSNCQARDLSTSLASAIGAVIDLNLVRNIVDIAVDRLQENSRQGRRRRAQKEQENIKTGITTVVGAALGEQQCWERTACKLGENVSEIPGELFTLFNAIND